MLAIVPNHEAKSRPATHRGWRAILKRSSSLAALLSILVCAAAYGQPSSPRLRSFAPGVLVTIPPAIEPEETVSTHDMVEIRANAALEWEPKFLANSRTLYGMSDDVKFRRDVWALEFAFKPLRMIEVPVLQPDGTSRSENVWYLVYRVRNTGAVLQPVEQGDGSFQPVAGQPRLLRFIPHFVLEGHDRDPTGRRVYRAYLDQIIPEAMERIRRRETPGRELHNSVEMAAQVLSPGDGDAADAQWGVAMWTGIDPRIDFFSVYVGGLTNAYRWVDPPGAYKLGDRPGTGRRYARKTLQLNFWRPGDEHLPHEEEIRFGVPLEMSELYGVPAGVAYRWTYR